jgi:thiol-disulfide isomerase/thioredoxin
MKSKTILVLMFVLISSLTAEAQNRSINFQHGNWKEIKEKAGAENKLIFVDAYTSWCGPCKWMAKNIFTNDTVADYYNQKFICAKLDMEEGEGLEFAQTYTVQAYPSLFFIDSKGLLVHRSVGAAPYAKDYIDLADIALSPEKSYSSYVEKYKRGDRSAVFLIDYLEATSNAGLNTDEIAKEYFATQNEKELSGENNWNMMIRFQNDVYSREFKYLLANRKVFYEKYSENSVDEKIYTAFQKSLYNALNNPEGDTGKYSDLKKFIVQSEIKNSGRLILKSDLTYYSSLSDWSNFCITADKLISKYYNKSNSEDAISVNNICWTIFEKVTDKVNLEKAIQWSKHSVELKDAPFMDTYANLLFKAGNKKEAIRIEEKVIEILKNSDNPQFPVEEAEKTLGKFRL